MCCRSCGALAGCQEQICRPQSYKDLTVFGYYQNKPLGAILTAPASGTETEEGAEGAIRQGLPSVAKGGHCCSSHSYRGSDMEDTLKDATA